MYISLPIRDCVASKVYAILMIECLNYLCRSGIHKAEKEGYNFQVQDYISKKV